MPSKQIDIAVVPVAGLGSRLLPATKSQPKEMLPVGRKPVVQYVVEELEQQGIEQVLFITGQGKSSLENHFDLNHELIETLREGGKEELLAELDFERTQVRYFFTRQRRLLGLGHAILCAKPFVGNNPFAVALGDSIIGLNAESGIVRRMADLFFERSADAVVAFEEVALEDIHHYGVAKPAETGSVFRLEDVVEKPSQEDAPSNLAIAARYIFSPAIFDALEEIEPGKNGEIQLTDAIRLLIQQGRSVYGLCLQPDEHRYDIGNFGSYYRAFVEFALADPQHGQSLKLHLEKMFNGDHP